MDLHLMGFAVALPVPNPAQLTRLRSAIRRQLKNHLADTQCLVRTFDGPDAGLPIGQALCTITPMYLDLVGRKKAGGDPMGFLNREALLAADIGQSANPDSLMAFCWKEENDEDSQALIVCGDMKFHTRVKGQPGHIMGTATGTLQLELLEAVKTTPILTLSQTFPHARQQVLDQTLPGKAHGFHRGSPRL